jgi:dTDP-4-dehydrorhamnose reductase
MSSYLVIGSEGQLGKCFQSLKNEFPQHSLHFANRKEVDLNFPETLSTYFTKIPFEGILNCAAYTQVDKAETEIEAAHDINEKGVQNLIAFGEAKNLNIIHFSTDFVFDGRKTDSYAELDATNPISVYGKSKLAGEKLLQKAKCPNVTFRVSWLFSPFGNNFVKTIINASQSKNELGVVADQFGKPTYGIDLAKAILNNLNHPNLFQHKILHYAQANKTSWYLFARKILELTASKCTVNPIPSESYPTAAKRPLNSSLNTRRIEETLSLSPRNWEEALSDCIKTIQTDGVI